MILRLVVLTLTVYLIISAIIFNSAVAQVMDSISERHTKISIYVFQDNNKNGLLDSGEHGLDNWFLIKGPGFNKNILIDSTKRLEVSPGKYFIMQYPRSNWENTTPRDRTIILNRSEQVSLYFGNYDPACSNCSTKSYNCSWTEPPQFDLTPRTMSFSSYNSDWDRLVIWLDNPQYCHIVDANIELEIPAGWIMRPSTEDTPLEFISNDNVLQIDNFGFFKNESMHDYIEVRPETDVSGSVWLTAIANINYLYRYPDAAYNLSCNTTQEFKIKLISKNSGNGLMDVLRANLSFIIAICAIITVIFGPGGTNRIDKIRKRFKK